MLYKNELEMELDFKNTHTTYSTHGFHTYPAKMIPQVAGALLDEYGNKANILFDPYCGTGTSLVEANLRNIIAVGTDLNPLARLIAKVKTTPIELQSLDLHLKDFYDYLFKFRFGFEGRDTIVAPSFKNIDFWLSKKVKNDLAVITHYISEIQNSDIKDFFKVALSQTIRECSWTRKNEFKLYKMNAEQLRTFKPETLSTFERVIGKNRLGLAEFMESQTLKSRSTIYDFDTVRAVPTNIISNNEIDIVVTSPPYGDSTTTVAYGQFSALANQWLGLLENGRSLDSKLMGGTKASEMPKFSSPILNEQLRSIYKVNGPRAFEVSAFYRDYENSIKHVSQVVRRKGFVCYVVSNRNAGGVTMSTDRITRDFFEAQKFNHVQTFERKITNKRMPKQNSPVGKSGNKGNLMNKEYVVVMQKR